MARKKATQREKVAEGVILWMLRLEPSVRDSIMPQDIKSLIVAVETALGGNDPAVKRKHEPLV